MSTILAIYPIIGTAIAVVWFRHECRSHGRYLTTDDVIASLVFAAIITIVWPLGLVVIGAYRFATAYAAHIRRQTSGHNPTTKDTP